ncbi:NUDIX domain-containing protein [Bacillus sp. CGMCC 1.16607]|uniref:NUDIX hydrolase n=1 Tax=Bacillus sp. CGMCC 1.16607 TaxID=3351842 RepID=UPI0036395C53
MLKYTICFIRRNDTILLLNRNKKPNMGLWNGVGGKIEANESPFDAIIREAREETGISLDKVIYAGDVIWKSEAGESGMYVFMAELPEGIMIDTPIQMEEGILDWKEIDWILNPNNHGVVSNIQLFLPKMLRGEYGLEHQFFYENGHITEYASVILHMNV